MANQKEKDAKKEEEEEEEPSARVIYVTVFFDFFASGIILPLLSNHAHKAFNASALLVGMVSSSYSLGSIVGSFLFGVASDRFGRRPVILLSLLMSVVTLYFTAAATTIEHLIATRAVAGFFSETSVCQAYLADKTTLKQRPKYLGHMGAFIGLGFMVGPMVGALISKFSGSFAMVGYFTTVVTALNFVYACLRLDESLGTRVKDKEEEELSKAPVAEFLKTFFRPTTLLIMVSQFACTVGFNGWNTTYPLFARDRLGYDQSHIGLAFAWFALALILAMWKMRAAVSKSMANLTLPGLLGTSMMAAALYAHEYVFSTVVSLVPLFMLGFGYGLAELVYQTVISVTTSKRLQGSLLGALSSMTAVARTVAPVLAGHWYDIDEDDVAFSFRCLALFPLAALVFTPLCCGYSSKVKTKTE